VEEINIARRWIEARVSKVDGSRVQSKDGYADFEEWCAEVGIPAMTSNLWGKVMKGPLKVEVGQTSGRTVYKGIALRRNALRLVASNPMSKGVGAGSRLAIHTSVSAPNTRAQRLSGSSTSHPRPASLRQDKCNRRHRLRHPSPWDFAEAAKRILAAPGAWAR
jgi:hypothetical protein